MTCSGADGPRSQNEAPRVHYAFLEVQRLHGHAQRAQQPAIQ
jgi:hypothetical protein